MTISDSTPHAELLSEAQRRALASYWRGTINWNASMAEYCTIGAGGKAAALIEVSDRGELSRLTTWLSEQGIQWLVIGRGSNILVSAAGFAGVFIRLQGEFKKISALEPKERNTERENEEQRIHVGGGCLLARVISWCARRNLSALEFLTGVPGGVGGAVYMNAGAWGGCVADRLVSVEYLDKQGVVRELGASDLEISYRRIRPRDQGLAGAVIIGATFATTPRSGEEIRRYCRELIEKRRKKQPLGVRSAGSFFKNPPGDAAGRLIEAAGLKGLRRGNAMVSPKHANFIVNTGRASADDIVELMQEVRKKVFEFSGIMLESEVHIL